MKFQLLVTCVFSILVLVYLGFTPFSEMECSQNNKTIRSSASNVLVDSSTRKCPPMPLLKKREETGTVMEAEEFTSFIEIGVQSGLFAEKVLSKWPSVKEYIGVDLWAQQSEYEDGANVDNNQQQNLYLETTNRLKQFQPRVNVTLLRDYSTKASALIPDESIDFIYVDARHDYDAVREDIYHYWHKLKPCGILGGHDFVDNDFVRTQGQDWSIGEGYKRSDSKAVKSAVKEFARFVKRELVITQEEWPSWYLRK